MSEANPPSPQLAKKRTTPNEELALALLELFEMLVANAVDKGDNITLLGEWADEWKPRLERLIRNVPSPPKQPQE